MKRKHLITESVPRGFTLVEILIVVIILGILAAIVIPQFSNASGEARRSSLAAQLRGIRSQITLYCLEHADEKPPALVVGGLAAWNDMVVKTTNTHLSAGGTLGPYLMSPPINHLNGLTEVTVVAGTADFGSGGVAAPAGSGGWVFNPTSGKLWATSAKRGFIYNERTPNDPRNEN